MYTIKDVSTLTGLSQHTLRYYEKENVLHAIARNDHGIRTYTEDDLELLKVIKCLKESGMSIKQIKDYVTLCALGNQTIDDRRNIFLQQKQQLQNEINKLLSLLNTVDYKIWYYDNLEHLEKIHGTLTCTELRQMYENKNT